MNKTLDLHWMEIQVFTYNSVPVTKRHKNSFWTFINLRCKFSEQNNFVNY